MKKLFYCIFALAISGIIYSCKKDNNEEEENRATRLFQRQAALIKIYTDSMRAARDSATISRIDKNFETAQTRLNYEYPVDLFLKMSEGENDTLTNLTFRYVQLRDSLLRSVSYNQVTDSTAIDSIRTQADKQVEINKKGN